MNFLPFFLSLLLTVLLGACASPTPPTTASNHEATKPVAEVRTDNATVPTAKRGTSTLKDFLDQVSAQQNIPLAFLDSGFKDVQRLSQVKKLVAPPPVSFKKTGGYTVRALLNRSAFELALPLSSEYKVDKMYPRDDYIATPVMKADGLSYICGDSYYKIAEHEVDDE